MESNFDDFSKSFYVDNDFSKISLQIETDDITNKNDIFEFMLDLLLIGVKKFGLNVEKIQMHFDRIDSKIIYLTKNEIISCPYIITQDLKIIKMYDSDDLVASYFYDNKWIYFRFAIERISL
jgi:hypothetical protein